MRLERETGPSHVVRVVLWAVGLKIGIVVIQFMIVKVV